jgi:hypothetical protein
MSECSCGQEYDYYCKPCSSAYFRDNFAHWTSGNSSINELIKNSQINANSTLNLIEWIEYANLENVEFVAHGGFGSVYKAVWKDGPVRYSQNYTKFELERDSNTEVAVKKFRDATHVSLEFLNEVNNLK